MQTIVSTFVSAGAWLRGNPVMIWFLVTAIVTAVFKPRSGEDEAAFEKAWPRLAAVVKAVAALGLDPIQFLQALGKVVKGAPKGPLVLLVAGALSVSSSACTPAARWAVADLLAEKIACAVAHQDMTTEQIIAACAIEPSDVPKVLAIVEKSRQRSAERALDAATRQAEFDAKLHRMEERAGCGNDRDGGADVTAPSAP